MPSVACAEGGLDEVAGAQVVLVDLAAVFLAVALPDLDVVGAAAVDDRLPGTETHAEGASVSDFDEPDGGANVPRFGLRDRRIPHLCAARSEDLLREADCAGARRVVDAAHDLRRGRKREGRVDGAWKFSFGSL